MDRPIMAGEIDDKRFADLVRNPFVIQDEFYIEEISWMLTVKAAQSSPPYRSARESVSAVTESLNSSSARGVRSRSSVG
jgi:hypothetical protein